MEDSSEIPIKYGKKLKRYWSGGYDLVDIRGEHNNICRL